jgi:hypothetical protein
MLLFDASDLVVGCWVQIFEMPIPREAEHELERR